MKNKYKYEYTPLFKVLFKCLFFLLLFLAPANFFYILSTQNAYVNGILVDYLMLKIYFVDVVIFGIFLLRTAPYFFPPPFPYNGRIPLSDKPELAVFLISGLCLYGLQFFADRESAIFYFATNLVLLFLLAKFIAHNSELFTKKIILFGTGAALIFQSLMGIFQFHTQQSLFGYYLLGEPTLHNYLGLAKASFSGAEKLLPYGTTAHPNVLAGFLSCYFWIFLAAVRKNYPGKIKRSSLLYVVCTVVSVLSLYTLYLTQSVSGWLTWFLMGGLYFLFTHKKDFMSWTKSYSKPLLVTLIAILIVVPSTITYLAHCCLTDAPSITRRAALQTAALRMINDAPIGGVGYTNFTVFVEHFSDSREIVRFIQPVHHVVLLWLAETGLLGLLVLVSLPFVIIKRGNFFEKTALIVSLPVLLAISPILSLDHYVLSLKSGELLFVLSVLSLTSLSLSEDPRSPEDLSVE